MDCTVTLYVESKLLLFVIIHCWAMTESYKNVLGVRESLGKVLDFFVSKRVGTLLTVVVQSLILDMMTVSHFSVTSLY